MALSLSSSAQLPRHQRRAPASANHMAPPDNAGGNVTVQRIDPKVLAGMVNRFATETGSFLEAFATRAEAKLMKLDQRVERLERHSRKLSRSYADLLCGASPMSVDVCPAEFTSHLAEEERVFPCTLTLCRPRLVGEEGLPFAEVEYQDKIHSIQEWPCLSLPFAFGEGDLQVRVFLADDEASYLQEKRRPLGGFRVSLQDLELRSMTSGEVWMPLSRRGWEEEAQSLSPIHRRPLGPSMRILLQHRESLEKRVWALSVAERRSRLRTSSSSSVALAGDAFARRPEGEASESVARWRQKFEKQQEHTEMLLKQHDEALSDLAREAQHRVQKAASVADCAHRQALACLVDACLRSWAAWVAAEKRERQFEQVAEDNQAFRDRCSSKRSASQAKVRQLHSEQEQAQLEVKRQGQLREQSLAILQSWLMHGQMRSHGCVCFGAWARHMRQRAFLLRIHDKQNTKLSRLFLLSALLAWRSLCGDEALESLVAQCRQREASASRLARAASAEAFASWVEHAARHGLLEAAVASWVDHLGRARFNQELGGVFLDVTDRLDVKRLKEWALLTWHSAVCDAEAQIQAERCSRSTRLRRRRELTLRVMDAPTALRMSGAAWFAFRRWRDVVEEQCFQKVMESQLTQKEQAQAEILSARKEISNFENAMAAEEKQWASERVDLWDRLKHLRAMLAESQAKRQELHEKRVLV
ncbi:unnamed protein product [Symbiodinium necroappetens]|uniref:Uncharacterized protein n=1 Tax=Symbiodinium necroappetens TaxID=1628268 RepID=A0A812NZS8_9DINO|nr:unnamed protein product [Symbiodinium necroappetens]